MNNVALRTVLVVDDSPESIDVIVELLRPICKVKVATSGEEALKLLDENNNLSAVLLDVVLPGISGFEVCRKIKETKAYMPVIMITSLEDRESRIKGIDSGADDLLTKPVDAAELRLKLRNAIKSKQLYDNLEKSYTDLQKLEEYKQQLTAFIVHDLRTPLTVVLGRLELLLQSNRITDSEKRHVNKARQNAQILASMIADHLDIVKLEARKLIRKSTPIMVDDFLKPVVESMEEMAFDRQLKLSCRAYNTKEAIEVDVDLMRRVIHNLLSNAIKHTPENGTIDVGFTDDPDSDQITLWVSNSGKNIPEEIKLTIFDRFNSTKTAEGGYSGSSGLGLTFCKLVVAEHNGKIWIEDREGGGSTFRFTVPKAVLPSMVAPSIS